MGWRRRTRRWSARFALASLSLVLVACPLTTFDVEPPTGASGNGGSGGGMGGSAGTVAAGTTGGPNGGRGSTTTPEPSADRFIMLQGESLTLLAPAGLLANDAPLGGLEVVRYGSNASLPSELEPVFNIRPDGRFDFTPPPRFFGRYVLSYTVQNANAVKASAEVEVLVVPTDIDLDAVAEGVGGFVLDGAPGDALGASLAGASDVNGDDLDDLLLGAPGANDGAGVAYVVFGKNDLDPLELSALPARTSEQRFVSFSGTAGEALGRSLSSLGDLDGDGGADLVLGAEGGSGRAYVVFTGGLSGGTTLPGSRAFTLEGDATQRGVGRVVRGVGDLDLDGAPDLVVSSRSGPYGWLHIVLGDASWTGSASVLDVAAFGVRGGLPDDRFPLDLAPSPDLNGDGYPELFLASLSQFALLLGGKSYPADLSELTPDGTQGGWSLLRGSSMAEGAVASAGDVDGDRAADVVYCDGVLYCRVVFGPPSTLATGWRIAGFTAEATRLLVDGGGDVDGDLLADVLFAESSRAYLVYGKPSGHTDVNLASLSSAGYSISAASEGSIDSVTFAGDVNGDGLGDLALGDASANAGNGRVYVVLGVASQ